MADQYVNFETEDLKESAKKHQKALMQIPFLVLRDRLAKMNPKAGVRGTVVFESLDFNTQIAPYRKRKNEDSLNIKGRPLTTYLGTVEQDFDPNELGLSIWADRSILGKDTSKETIAMLTLAQASRSIGENISLSLWNAKRSDDGKTTDALFDGFDTITADEVTKGNISKEKGNLFEFGEALSMANAVDKLKEMYRSAHFKLRSVKTCMYMPEDIYDAFVDNYKATGTGLAYNKEFEKYTLEGSRGRCEIVPDVSKEGSEFIQLTPKENLMAGFYGLGNDPKEFIGVGHFNHFDLTLGAGLYFGVNFFNIDKEMLLVGKLKKTEEEG